MPPCKLCDSENALALCSNCKSVYYCDSKCQKMNFILHNVECETIKINKTRKIPEQCKETGFLINDKDRCFQAVNMSDCSIIEKSVLWKVIDDDLTFLIPSCSRIGIIEISKPFIFCCTPNCLNSHSSTNDVLFIIKLKRLMGSEIWKVFAYQYEVFARGKAAESGYGYMLENKVVQIRKWYFENCLKVDKFIDNAKENKINCPYYTLWIEFHAMWINGSVIKQKNLIKWVISQDCGAFATSIGLIHSTNLFDKFNKLNV